MKKKKTNFNWTSFDSGVAVETKVTLMEFWLQEESLEHIPLVLVTDTLSPFTFSSHIVLNKETVLQVLELDS